MEKRFWIIIGVIAIAFIGFLWFSNQKDKDTGGGGTIQASNHVKGNENAKVTLVEYGDFQCPVCGSYYPVVAQVVEKYKDDVKFQFRNLPLSQIHNNAFAAARAAEAASEQGKFWEMYDLLFTNQQAWSQSSNAGNLFKQYAGQLGLDINKYNTDASGSKVNKIVNADIEAFKKTGADMATPAFFLNGKELDLKQLATEQGPSLEKFSGFIDAELKKQGQ